MRMPVRLALIGLSLALCAGVLRASSIDTRMDVTATVVSDCRVTVPPLSFGTYDPLSANASRPADAAVDVTLNCTRNTTAAVSFDLGLHTPGGVDRTMSGPGSERLRYQIYRDPARSQIWSTGSEALRIVAQGVNVPDQLTVFGRIPPSQEVEPGAYTDVLTATVDF